MVTMSEIAEKAGVSRYTASKVLNGDKSVKAALRERVLAACRDCGYIPDSRAISLVKGHSDIIGVIVPYLTDDFYSEFVETLDQVVLAKGYRPVYRSSYNSAELESDILRMFLSIKVCGLVVAPVVSGIDRETHALAARNVPVVYFDRCFDENTWHVVNDNHAGTFAATTLMLEKGRTPAYLGSFYRETNSTAKQREQGYADAMKAAGKHPLLLDVSGSAEQQDNEKFGCEVVRKHLEHASAPDALLCVTDSVAFGAMRALFEVGLLPGKDILVCGHDNLRFSAYTTPALTTVRQRQDLFASTCMEILEQAFAGNPPARKEYRFEPELILRETT